MMIFYTYTGMKYVPMLWNFKGLHYWGVMAAVDFGGKLYEWQRGFTLG